MTRTTIENKLQQYIDMNGIVCESGARPKFCEYRYYDVNCPMHDVDGGMCIRKPYRLIQPVVRYKIE